jgi:phytoene synthase
VIAPALEVEYCCRRCEQITRSEAANFSYGIRLLNRDKRYAMSAVYAFARRIDDIGDGDLPQDAQLSGLAAERAMLETLDDDGRAAPGDPVPVALSWARRRYDLPLDALGLLVEGVELDVLGSSFQTFDQLVGYCRCVAGAVGRLCVAIFADGRVDARMDTLADDLGVAMQLANVLRDIREDLGLGRVYLPAEDLQRFGCEDLADADEARAVQLIRFEAARAAEWFDRGLQLTEYLDARSASCVLAMTGIYRSILQRIVADPGQVLRERISLAPWEKAWVAARSLAGAGAGAVL